MGVAELRGKRLLSGKFILKAQRGVQLVLDPLTSPTQTAHLTAYNPIKTEDFPKLQSSPLEGSYHP